MFTFLKCYTELKLKVKRGDDKRREGKSSYGSSNAAEVKVRALHDMINIEEQSQCDFSFY